MNRSGDVTEQGAAAQASSEELGERRRSRMSARLSGVFGGRRGRAEMDRSPTQVGEGSRTGAQQGQSLAVPSDEVLSTREETERRS